MTDCTLDSPTVDASGWRTCVCSCGQRFTAATLDELQPELTAHVDKPLREAVSGELRCIVCSKLTTFDEWPLCAVCQQQEHAHMGSRPMPPKRGSLDRERSSSGATTLTVLVVLTCCATIGAALRYDGWARLAIVLVAVALLGVGLRLDARPPVRRQ